MRRMLAIVLGSLALSLVIGGPVLADTALPGPSSRPAPVTKFDFEEDVVIGTMSGPLGEVFTGKAASKHSSLIKIRTHFVPEMFRTVNDL